MFINIKNMEVKKIKRNGEEMWGYYLNYTDENNRIHKERKGSKDWKEKDAIEAQNILIGKLKAGMTQPSATVKLNRKNDITVEEVYQEYMSAKQESFRHGKRTEYDHYKVAAKHIFPKFINEKEVLNTNTNKVELVKVPKPIMKITQEDIKKWRKDLNDATYSIGEGSTKKEIHYSSNQLIKIQSLCKAIFAYAKLHGYVNENPLDFFETIRKNQFTKAAKKVYTLMTFEEYDKFMTTIENYKDKNGNVDEVERLQSMLMFSIYFCLGIRLAECLQLKFSDYKETERTLFITKSWDYVTNTVKGPKTKNSLRDFYVGYEIHTNILNLAAYYKKIGIYSEDLQMFSSFTTAKHRPGQNTLSPTTVRRKRDLYLTEAGLSHMRIHDFRHSSASHLLSRGVTMEQISKHLGDTESIADAVYSHMNRDAKKDIANQFDRKNIK